MRGMQGVKEAAVIIPGVGDVKVAIISGLSNARKVMDQIRAGNAPWAFIEVMACPGGCQYGEVSLEHQAHQQTRYVILVLHLSTKLMQMQNCVIVMKILKWRKSIKISSLIQ